MTTETTQGNNIARKPASAFSARRSGNPVHRESEADFQRAVIELATLAGWLCWHDTDSRKNAPGLPDLLLVRGERLIFAEIKTATGRLRPAQREWLDALASVPGIETYVWRPSDWPVIEQILQTVPSTRFIETRGDQPA